MKRTGNERLTFILLLGALVMSPALAGQTAGGIKRPLTIDEALTMGTAYSPAVHSSGRSVEALQAASQEAAAARLPSVKLGAGYTRLSEVPPFRVTLPFSINGVDSFVVSPYYFDNFSFRASLQQPVFTGFRLESASDSARALERSAAMYLDRDRSDNAFRIKKAYWGLVGRRQAMAVIREAGKQVEEHLKDVRAFYGQGLLTRNDVLRAEVRLSGIELQEVEAGNAAALAEAELNSLLGLPLETGLEPTTAPETVARTIDYERIAGGQGRPEAAGYSELEGHPEISSFKFKVESAEAGLRAARGGFLPQVYLTANYYYMNPNPRYMPNKDRFDDTWDVGVTVSLDLWNWGQTKQQVRQARARLDQARDAVRLAEDKVKLELTGSRLAVTAARAKSVTAARTVGMAEENLRVTRERFREGVALNSDVLDAETELLQARLAVTQASVETAVALASYERALGR